MAYVFEMTLPDALYAELIDAADERHCSPRIFAEETILSALATRRLPRVSVDVEALERTSIKYGEGF
jgi:hypothetical protein